MEDNFEKEIEKMKQRIQLSSYFDFMIPDYVILDLVDNEDFKHFELMVNMASLNSRISKENAFVLKQKCKEIFNIKSRYDKFDLSLLKENEGEKASWYKEWQKKYHTEEFIDLSKYFDEKDKQLLKKLGIDIMDKIYTNYEFDVLDENYIEYYEDETMDEEELKMCKKLPEDVTRDEYNILLKKFEKIQEDFKL